MQSAWTTMHPDLEVLEASSGPDYLWGNDLANTIWGRAGGDHIWGLGGNDTIEGAGGNDVIDAGGQPGDKVSYGADD
jgi:Ca2+-binding RTX toxin-like protein